MSTDKDEIKSIVDRWYELRQEAETKAQFEQELREYIAAQRQEAELKGISRFYDQLRLAYFGDKEFLKDLAQEFFGLTDLIRSKQLKSNHKERSQS